MTPPCAPSRQPNGWPTSLVTPHTLAPRLRSHLLQTLVRIGETRRVEQALADMDGPERERAEIRIAEASLRLAQDDPKAATDVLAPVIDGSVPLHNAHLWEVQAFLLQAIACDALGDAGAARRALEQALDRPSPNACSSRSCTTRRPSCSTAIAGMAPRAPA